MPIVVESGLSFSHQSSTWRTISIVKGQGKLFSIRSVPNDYIIMGVSEMDARGIHMAFIVKLLALKYVCPSLTHPITISAPSILP